MLLDCVMIERETVHDTNSNSIDIPLDTNVGADLESLDLVDLEALDLVDLEALDTSVALVALEPIGLNIAHKEVKTGVSNIVFSVSRHQGVSRVSLQHLLLAFFFGFVVDLDPFVFVNALVSLEALDPFETLDRFGAFDL